jgi:hypothetical protein
MVGIRNNKKPPLSENGRGEGLNNRGGKNEIPF